jgi:L-glyceraldehyde 3-phosphate reductase
MDTTTTFVAESGRYAKMAYRRSGRSGVDLPMLSLGFWQNFGGDRSIDVQRAIVRRAFDLGITHFDLANNYGPPYGAAETNVARLLAEDLAGYRDELIISTKAGWDMWPGPYGDHGSRKYLLASLDQSLSRLGLEYVDIFYSHRPDPDTPLEETMGALHTAVQQGKALYVGISSYGPERTRQAAAILRDLGTPLLIHQPSYSMLNRWVEHGLLDVLEDVGAGAIAFTALAQGLLTPKYLDGIPADSRAAAGNSTLSPAVLTRHRQRLQELNQLAGKRGQSLAQMALSWVLRDPRITSVVIGASSVQQLEDNIAAIHHTEFTSEQLNAIDSIAGDDPQIDLWREQSQIGPGTKAPHAPA